MIVPDFSMTTLAAAMANAEKAVGGQVDELNAQAIAAYHTAFNDYSINVAAGRVLADGGPEVPFRWEVDHFTDPTNDKALWAYPRRSTTTRVCPMALLPAAPKPYAPALLPLRDDVMQPPPGDKMPIGYVVVDKAGATWEKEQSETPFGPVVLYRRISVSQTAGN